MFTENEVREATLEYFKNDVLATDVWMKKYCLRDKDGKYLEKTPDDMHRRLAKEFARIEKKYPYPLGEDEIYEYLKDFKYIVPQGSPMSGIGNNEKLQSLSNCVVIAPPEDTMSGIVETARDMANLFKRRAGCGIDISSLRPDGSPVNNSAGTSTGAWSFADFYSYVTRMVGQSGRRGALLVSMDVRHPDIYKFIKMKHDLTKVTGANISVKLTDEFMKAVEEDKTFILRFPCEIPANEKMGMALNQVYKFPDGERTKIKARELWEEIVKSATYTAEPGIFFWDEIERRLPADKYPDFKTTSTNPCFSGDTRIAVADGRNSVTIKQLAEEKKDVPVYSLNEETGKVVIQKGIHPRITGEGLELYRVTLDDNSFLDVTGNHQFFLKDGTIKTTLELEHGDSLPQFTKRAENATQDSDNQYFRVTCDAINTNKDKLFEHRLIAKYYNPEKWDEIYNEDIRNGWKTGGLSVHHKDHNTLNNSIDNLDIMTFEEHASMHSKVGSVGEKNGRWIDISNQEIKEIVREEMKRIGRMISLKHYQKIAREKGLPVLFTKERIKELGETQDFLREIAVELGFENIEADPRLLETKKEMDVQGYETRLNGNIIEVEKNCEYCGRKFWINHLRREQAYCSQQCLSDKIADASREDRKKTGEDKKQKQLKLMSQLRFDLGKFPNQKQWRDACRENGVPQGFGDTFGFKTFTELKEASKDYNHKVVSVEKLDGLHTVYNITVEDTHTVGIITREYENKRGNPNFIGVFTPQCGELPLSNHDSCRLITINLKHFVDQPFTDNVGFDIEKFRDVVKVATRLSDDLVDLELEKIDQIVECTEGAEKELWLKMRQTASDGRRTGLGTHGLADCLSRLRIKYGEQLEVVNHIYETLRDVTYDTSVELAVERGTFPVYDLQYETSEFLKDLAPEVQLRMKKHGRRNISLLTNAPTGSVSILSQTSSGIEPVFKNSYKRRRKISEAEADETSFKSADGEYFQEYEVFHHNIKEYMETQGIEDELPDYFIEAGDVEPEKRVMLQSCIGQSIDHSLSSTINLPRGTSPEVVGKIYMDAWKKNLKGVTVYVDGCREGVLVDGSQKEEEFQERSYIARDEILECDIHHRNVDGQPYVVLIGKKDGRPYEVFAGREAKISIPKKYEVGKIRRKVWKTKNNRYDLMYDEDGVIKDIVNVFDNPNNSTLGRMISLSLRYGAMVSHVVEQLQQTHEDSSMNCFSRVIARVLKTYIEDGTKPDSGKVCPSCEEDSLVYQDGCVVCMNCGWSRCM